jgi:AMMECR1 domain-containing protein
VAAAAGLRDLRRGDFERVVVVRDELEDLLVEVTVLSPLRSVASPEAYRFGRDGLALTRDKKGALFLPQEGWRDAKLFAFEGQAFAEGHGGAGVP